MSTEIKDAFKFVLEIATPNGNAHLEAMAEAKVVDKAKVIANTPVATTPTTMTGFRPNLSANTPQA